MDYAPDTVDDTGFCGIVLDCPEVCRVHKLQLRKCVAFQGTDTSRKFYMCQIQNLAMNCGFNSWLDPEWPETLKNALATLSEKYHCINSLRIDERIENATLVKEITDEKIKIYKKYSSLVGDANKFMDDTEIKIQKDNYANIMGNEEDQKGEVEALKDEVANLKQAQKTQAMIMRNCEVKLGDEREYLKKENKKLKKKLEYKIQYLINTGQDNMDKLMRI
ncbi:hypothetical protein ACQ4PT_065731 [Festuca glaucescens]